MTIYGFNDKRDAVLLKDFAQERRLNPVEMIGVTGDRKEFQDEVIYIRMGYPDADHPPDTDQKYTIAKRLNCAEKTDYKIGKVGNCTGITFVPTDLVWLLYVDTRKWFAFPASKTAGLTQWIGQLTSGNLPSGSKGTFQALNPQDLADLGFSIEAWNHTGQEFTNGLLYTIWEMTSLDQSSTDDHIAQVYELDYCPEETVVNA